MIYVFDGGSVVYDGGTITEEQKKHNMERIVLEDIPEPYRSGLVG